MNNSTEPTVIVGAGFAGLFTALHLRHQRYPDPIILIDPQKRFVFKPLLYELLSDELPEDAVCPSYEELLSGSGITLVSDRVSAIDLNRKQIDLASGLHYTYRHLVLGVGSIQGYLGTQGAAENAFAFRTRENVIDLKHHLGDCLQRAKQTDEAEQKRSLLTFAVVGAGPSGVETAATLADLLPQWYAELGGNTHDIRIVLVNHGEAILSGDVNEHLREVALKAFKTRTVPVDLLLNVGVKTVLPDRLEYQRNEQAQVETLPTQTTIWTAGTATHPLIQSLSSQMRPDRLDKHGLPLVTPTLQLPDFPDVFVAGDCANVQEHRQPALAQVAYQQGAAIAHNLLALARGKTLSPAKVSLRGTLMKLGLGNGVANLFDKIQINGKTGDLIRNATYLELLPTPLHNFKATTHWLEDEIFHRYHHRELLPSVSRLSPAERRERSLVWGIAIIAPLVFMITAYLGLRTPPTELRQPASNKGAI